MIAFAKLPAASQDGGDRYGRNLRYPPRQLSAGTPQCLPSNDTQERQAHALRFLERFKYLAGLARKRDLDKNGATATHFARVEKCDLATDDPVYDRRKATG